MNISVVVEGRGDKRLYAKWVSFVNPSLTYVDSISYISNNHFTIVSGHGYPCYLEVVDRAIDDVNCLSNIDRLVIAVDSEEMSFDEKMDEILNHINCKPCSASIRIVIQHFCLETWALGNKRVGPRNPSTPALMSYKSIFDVVTHDPELLPSYPQANLKRSQFAEKYLRAMLVERNRNLGYVKGNPKALLSGTYFEQVKRRLETTGHIASFSTFLSAFS